MSPLPTGTLDASGDPALHPPVILRSLTTSFCRVICGRFDRTPPPVILSRSEESLVAWHEPPRSMHQTTGITAGHLVVAPERVRGQREVPPLRFAPVGMTGWGTAPVGMTGKVASVGTTQPWN
jgi:hypothetical protein